MWYFFSPKVVFGEESVNYIENIKGEKCFIITDKNLEELGLVKILTDKLDSYNKVYKIFTDVKPDPHEEDIMKGKEECISYSPDIIIALGGGSVIDTAKAIWAMNDNPDFTVDDLHPFNDKLLTLGRKTSMIAIPTTSGTGAETTWAIVISRLQNDIWIKLEQAHKSCMPQIAILDPVFTMGMPPELTAATGFDALAHSIEGISSDWRNEFSNAMCLKAIELIFKWLPIAVKDGDNKEARDYMQQAANMAGLGFGNSQVHIGHAMGHSWGAIFHLTHGLAVGTFLKYVTMYLLNNRNENDISKEIFSKLVKQLGWAKWEDENKKAAFIIVKKIKELEKACNLPGNLKAFGVSKQDFENNLDMLITLCYQSSSSVMSPRSPDSEDYKKLFTYAYEGKDIDF
ncbi:MAG: iron-containing alcohol dehydrogenase [Promethearchaeota archaeon]